MDDRKLKELIENYLSIFDKMRQEVNSGNLSPLSYNAIIKLSHRVVYKLTMKQGNVQKKVGDLMGGKVLDLPEFRIYHQGKDEGRAEGEKERLELKAEIDRLRKELEQIKKEKE